MVKKIYTTMINRKTFLLILSVFFCCAVSGQQSGKSELEERAEAVNSDVDIAKARSLYIHAFNDYISKNQVRQGVGCGVKATALYYRENFYKEAFDLLRRIDQVITASDQSAAAKSAQHYLATKERMQMYIKMKRSPSAQEQLNIMEGLANASGDESVKNDLLYNKAIFYYTFGQNAQGNAVFREMAGKLTAEKEYDKVDEVYKTLIANGRRSNSANLVAQSYSSYMAWKDSVTAIKHVAETDSLKQLIATHEATIEEKDSSLSGSHAIIATLGVLAAALAAALVALAFVLMKYIVQTKKQKKTIRLANESNALKAKFISNISAQLEPTLNKLDKRIPEVKAMMDFTKHVQTLSELENNTDMEITLEDTQIQPFCETIIDGFRSKVGNGVTLKVVAPKMVAKINREYVTHILNHLLGNATEYTGDGDVITLEFKKRSAHSFQFIVSNTGTTMDESLRENVFKPFAQIKDLTTGDGLGLPICKQMAVKMGGDLDLSTEFTKGTRFVLSLKA